MTAEWQKLYRKIKTKFSEIDKDSDGYIVADEVDTYMKSLDSRWKKADSIVRQFSELSVLINDIYIYIYILSGHKCVVLTSVV